MCLSTVLNVCILSFLKLSTPPIYALVIFGEFLIVALTTAFKSDAQRTHLTTKLNTCILSFLSVGLLRRA